MAPPLFCTILADEQPHQGMSDTLLQDRVGKAPCLLPWQAYGALLWWNVLVYPKFIS